MPEWLMEATGGVPTERPSSGVDFSAVGLRSSSFRAPHRNERLEIDEHDEHASTSA